MGRSGKLSNSCLLLLITPCKKMTHFPEEERQKTPFQETTSGAEDDKNWHRNYDLHKKLCTEVVLRRQLPHSSFFMFSMTTHKNEM